MTSLMWRYRTDRRLLSVGIDQVEINRFENLLAGDPHPMPFVFSRREIDRARTLKSAKLGLSICFGCKEALMKAIGEPYDFTQCELFPDPDDGGPQMEGEIALGTDLADSYGIRQAVWHSFVETVSRDEITSVVFVFGEASR